MKQELRTHYAPLAVPPVSTGEAVRMVLTLSAVTWLGVLAMWSLLR